MTHPQVLILHATGTNRDVEAAKAVELAGGAPSIMHVNQLRDPAIFEEDGRIYLLYSVAGESGIAIAELTPSLLANNCIACADPGPMDPPFLP